MSGEHLRVDPRAGDAGASLFRTMIEHLPDLAWTLGPDGDAEYYNRRFYEYTGTTFDAVKGWGWTSVHDPALVEGVVARFQRAFADGEPFELESALRARDGGFRWFLLRANPVCDADGRVSRFVVTGTDVDQRKRAERALRVVADAGAVLASALDSEQTVRRVAALAVPDFADLCLVDLLRDTEPARAAVFHADPEQSAACRRLEQFSGFGPRHPAARALALGKPLLVRDAGREELAAWLTDAAHVDAMLAFGAPISLLIAPLSTRGHSLGVLTLIATPRSGLAYTEDDLALAEELGRRAGAAIENAYLFESGQRERISVTEANRAKDEFLAVVSHELRTPLNAILGWARMLKTRTLTADLEQRAIDTIERNARVQAQLIEDLLDISRIISGKLRLSLECVQLSQIVTSAVDTVSPAAQARGVELAVQIEDEGTISGDAGRLQQVVGNLLSNAVKFTPRAGRVEVRLSRRGDAVELSVADTGRGIAPEFLPHVFERFRQEDGSVTRETGGLGLGLSIVKNLIELHGGSVAAESAGDGCGATFVVRLPLAFTGPASARSSAPALHASLDRVSAPHDLEGLRLLVVDDEPDARELLRSMLEQRKATVSVAASSDEAYERFLSVRPDVLISDIGMPGTDGYTLMHRIRALPPEQGGRTPAVALTAFSRMGDRTRALLAGYNLHVAKPVEAAELVVVVATLAGKLVSRC